MSVIIYATRLLKSHEIAHLRLDRTTVRACGRRARDRYCPSFSPRAFPSVNFRMYRTTRCFVDLFWYSYRFLFRLSFLLVLEHQIHATVAVIDDRKASKAIIGYK